MRTDERGSIWRRWDLHFHTPSSYDYQDKSTTNEAIVTGLIKNGIKVVAVTDHHVIDVDRIRRLQELAGDELTVLPGIELRSELGGSESVHLIGLFPEDADLAEIETKLLGTLNITPADIRAKGHEKVYVDFRQAAQLIRDELKGLVSVHVGRRANTIERIANAPKFKQAVKEDLAKDCIDIFEVANLDDVEAYHTIVFREIRREFPIVVCSDNHRIADYRPSCPCWIMADPNFAGLTQILFEPELRVYRGTEPPRIQQVARNKTKYIDAVRVQKIAGSQLDEHWFNCTLPLNPGLIAIIGNKGDGKSALADIIALGGNALCERMEFLNTDRFRQPRDNKASHFEAQLWWQDESAPETIRLDEDYDPSRPERVRYLPQQFIEKLCNEIGAQSAPHFDAELSKVIFSHVGAADRLGKDSLQSLLDYRTEQVNVAIEFLRNELHGVNQRIVELEIAISQENKQQLGHDLSLKRAEVRAHLKARPAKVVKPEDDALPTVTAEIAAKTDRISTISERLEQIAGEREIVVAKEAALRRLRERIANLQSQHARFVEESEEDVEQLGVVLNDIVKITVDTAPLDAVDTKCKQELSDLQTETMGEDGESGLAGEKEGLTASIATLKAKLSAPHQAYQAHLENQTEWKDRAWELIGDNDLPGTLRYYKAKTTWIEKDAPTELEKCRDDRRRITATIHDRLREIVATYEELYGPVQEFISDKQIIAAELQLEFAAAIEGSQFVDQFLRRINQGRRGSFQGIEEGKERARQLLSQCDLSSAESVTEFVDGIVHQLRHNVRAQPPEQLRIDKQLTDANGLGDLYDFIYGLEYLRPHYTLRLGEKGIIQLSPGERGVLLLVFYLLLDKDEVPLIIDQPEQNLDNESIYKILVQCIREAKQHRQIIVVTHNPNLAIVCDAEQVICASIAKTEGNRVTYKAGAIENPKINLRAVNVLEGTWPAFQKREERYQVSAP